MSDPLEFTGERFVPGIPGEIVYEHWHRYAFARRFVAGRRVLDVACGEGYGSALLAASAAQVCGVDISQNAINHAQNQYAAQKNLSFQQGSATELPLPDHSVDVVVSFETIEHLPQAMQQPMIQEFARVLTPDGLLIISSPNRPEYSPPGTPANPYHVHELDRDEFQSLLSPYFPVQSWWAQRLYFGSVLWREENTENDGEMIAEACNMKDEREVVPAHVPPAKYFVVIAGRKALSQTLPQISLFSDAKEKELHRLYHQAEEVLRLDTLAHKQTDALNQLATKYQALSKEAQTLRETLNQQNVEFDNLQKQFDFRNSWQGWLRFPLSRLRRRMKK